MAGLPASPLFANEAATAAGEVNVVVVAREASRKRKLEVAYEQQLTSGGALLVTAAEYGQAEARVHESVAQAAGAAVAPPWFASFAVQILSEVPVFFLQSFSSLQISLDSLTILLDPKKGQH